MSHYGSPGLEQRRVRIRSGGEGSNRRYGTAVNSERFLFVWPCCNNVRCNCWDRDGPPARIGKSPTFSCWRFVGATPCSFRETSSFQHVGAGQSRAMHKPSILGRNHCCATRKRANMSLSLIMASREWTKSGQEDCAEWTKLKNRPEERDAWTKVVKKIVTSEQH